MAGEIGEGGALAQEFVQFALDSGVLRFGQFKTKAGRMSPYFFNAGLFDDGANVVLMNTDTYEQIGLPRDGVADELQYLKEGDVVQLLSLDGRAVATDSLL